MCVNINSKFDQFGNCLRLKKLYDKVGSIHPEKVGYWLYCTNLYYTQPLIVKFFRGLNLCLKVRVGTAAFIKLLKKLVFVFVPMLKVLGRSILFSNNFTFRSKLYFKWKYIQNVSWRNHSLKKRKKWIVGDLNQLTPNILMFYFFLSYPAASMKN